MKTLKIIAELAQGYEGKLNYFAFSYWKFYFQKNLGKKY